MVAALDKGGGKDDTILASARDELAALNKRRPFAARLLTGQRKRATLEKKLEKLGVNLTDAQVEATAAVERAQLAQQQIEECQAEQRLHDEETRELAATATAGSKPMPLFQKLGVQRGSGPRSWRVRRKSQPPSRWSKSCKPSRPRPTPPTPRAGRLSREEMFLWPRPRASPPRTTQCWLSSCSWRGGDEPLASLDGVVDLAAAERRRGFKERLAATVPKRVRQHG